MAVLILIAYLLTVWLIINQKRFLELGILFLITLILAIWYFWPDEVFENSPNLNKISGKSKNIGKKLLCSKIAEITIVGMMVCLMLISYIAGWPIDIVIGTEAGILLMLMFKIAVRMNTNKNLEIKKRGD